MSALHGQAEEKHEDVLPDDLGRLDSSLHDLVKTFPKDMQPQSKPLGKRNYTLTSPDKLSKIDVRLPAGGFHVVTAQNGTFFESNAKCIGFTSDVHAKWESLKQEIGWA